MSIWIDQTYAKLLASHVRNFKQKDQYLYNFSCVFCGDSAKNRYKARGYLHLRKGGLFYKCHNCGKGTSLGGLIKEISPELYQQYRLERYASGDSNNVKKPKFEFKQPFESSKKAVGKPRSILDELMVPVADLGEDHPCRRYVEGRQIPEQHLRNLYYLDDTQKFAQLSSKYKDRIKGREPRLILPFFDRYGRLTALQGRLIGDGDGIRYLTIKLSNDKPLCFGLERLDYNKRILCLEGPIDSLFLPNAVAAAGSDFFSALRALPRDRTIVVYDNERRNKEIIQQIKKTVEMGYTISLFPQTVQGKDVNNMVMNGMSSEQVENIILNNTYSGLSAKLALSNWKRK